MIDKAMRGTDGDAPRVRRHRRIGMLRGLLAISLTIVALLVLAGGSALVAGTLLWQQPYEYDIATQQAEAAGYAIGLVWPATVFVAWLSGTLALLTARRADKTPAILAGSIIAVVIVPLVVGLAGPHLPARGPSSVVIVLPFLALNGGAMFAAWRYILPAMRPPGARV